MRLNRSFCRITSCRMAMHGLQFTAPSSRYALDDSPTDGFRRPFLSVGKSYLTVRCQIHSRDFRTDSYNTDDTFLQQRSKSTSVNIAEVYR